MTEILSTEFYRLKKSKMFWWLLGISTLLPVLTVLLLVGLTSLLGIFETDTGIDAWSLMQSLDVTASLLSGYGVLMHTSSLFAVICTSIFLSGEFKFGTYRNALLACHSRTALFLSYLIVALVVGTSFLGGSMLVTLIMGGSIFGFYQMTAWEVCTSIATAFAMGLVSVVFVQTLMCMFLFATRKRSVTLACTIALGMFLPSIASAIVQGISLLTLATAGGVEIDVSWIPFYNTELLDVSNINGALIGKILLYNVPLSALFCVTGWACFRKADLK